MDKPAVAGLPSKRHRGDGEIQRFGTKKGESARESPRNLRCTESMSAIRDQEARNLNKNKKGDFECEVKSCADSDRSTGNWGLHVQWRVCWGQRDPGAHCGMITCQFPSSFGGLLDYLLDGCIGLASDGEVARPTQGAWMPRIAGSLGPATSMGRAQK